MQNGLRYKRVYWRSSRFTVVRPRRVRGAEITYGTEDCLIMNIYRSHNRTADPSPILLWIFGGDNTLSEIIPYNATQLAGRHNAIVLPRDADAQPAAAERLDSSPLGGWARGFVRRTGFPEVPVGPAYHI